MNTTTSSLEGNHTASRSDPNGSEVIKLTCPSCHKELNLLRQHIGIEGNCVHCQAPVKAAIAKDGTIAVENISIAVTGFSESKEELAPIPESTESSPFASALLPVVDSAVAPEMPAMESPEPFAKPDTDTAVPPEFSIDQVAGFQGKPDQLDTVETPSESKLLEADAPISSGSKEREVASSGNPLAEVQSAASPFSTNAEEVSFLEKVAMTDSLPETLRDSGARTPWDEPAGMAASSPSLGEAGFAEALFTGKGGDQNQAGETADTSQQAEKKLPSSTTQNPSLKKLKSPKSAVSNSPTFKILRLIVALLIIGGVTYGAYQVIPLEKVEAVKVQVKEWLKPGAILLRYIPGWNVDAAEVAAPAAVPKAITPSASTQVPEVKGQQD